MPSEASLISFSPTPKYTVSYILFLFRYVRERNANDSTEIATDRAVGAPSSDFGPAAPFSTLFLHAVLSGVAADTAHSLAHL